MSMAKIAYITEKSGDGVMSSFGMDVFSHSLDDSLSILIADLIKENYAIVYVSEAIYKRFEKDINDTNHNFEITVLVLANAMNHEHLGSKRLKMLIEDAVGIKVE